MTRTGCRAPAASPFGSIVACCGPIRGWALAFGGVRWAQQLKGHYPRRIANCSGPAGIAGVSSEKQTMNRSLREAWSALTPFSIDLISSHAALALRKKHNSLKFMTGSMLSRQTNTKRRCWASIAKSDKLCLFGVFAPMKTLTGRVQLVNELTSTKQIFIGS
jgi:hypothetical protein